MERLIQISIKLFFIFITTFLFSNPVSADPPTRVIRLSYIDGSVSFSPAGFDDWIAATYNWPLTVGDRLWTDVNSRAELQLGPAIAHLGPTTSLTILNRDDHTAQFQLQQGTLHIHVWNLDPNQVYEVDTPNLAYVIQQAGDYRIDVDVNHNATTVTVRQGQGDIYGQSSSFILGAPQSCAFTGTSLGLYTCTANIADDDFDRWCSARDELVGNAIATPYVSDDVVGDEDLNAYGQWSYDQQYGYVWSPNDVDDDWAPYSDGQWAWVNPWGWSWVGHEPWGFAPYHYGRWFYSNRRWCWVPGPKGVSAVYAPAVVGFIGGNKSALLFSNRTQSGIGWFPLAPGEAYIPPYSVSRNYFSRINTSNTVINPSLVTNLYANPNQNITYRNKLLPHAITAVPINAFVQSQSVSKAMIPVAMNSINKLPVSSIAPLAPTSNSVLGAGINSNRIIAPPQLPNLPVVVKATPPNLPIPFSQQQPYLGTNPGRPLSGDIINKLRAPVTTINPQAPIVNQQPRVVNNLHGQGRSIQVLPVPPINIVPHSSLAPNLNNQPGQARGIQVFPAGPTMAPHVNQGPVFNPAVNQIHPIILHPSVTVQPYKMPGASHYPRFNTAPHFHPNAPSNQNPSLPWYPKRVSKSQQAQPNSPQG